MKKPQIEYKCGYKYQLHKEYTLNVEIYPNEFINTDYIYLNTNGMLVIKKGYAWDGPSGPTFDTKNFMRGSLVHDALYQLIRIEKIDYDKYRNVADRELQRICIEDGMCRIRAWWVYQGVRFCGKKAARPENRKKIHISP